MRLQRQWWLGWGIAACAACAVFACSRSPTGVEGAAQVGADIAQAAAAITGQEAVIANEVAQGKHLGFDTNVYPGDDVMRAWKQAPDAPYSWVGFYLPAPCHSNSSWSGKRETLQEMGWGLAVVYVGQQTWGRPPRPLPPERIAELKRRGTTCSADFLTAAEGGVEANDAIEKTEKEGFAHGTVVFLDIERMERIPQAMRAYYGAWVSRMLEDGRYQPGIYTHKHNADVIYADVKARFVAAGVKDEPRFWIASARDFDPSKPPTEVGHEFAGVWQGVIDVMRSVGDVPLPVDINVSAWPSPSETGVIRD